MGVSYAAAICLLFGLGWTAAVHSPGKGDKTITQQELFVPPGQRAWVTLPDGSQVWVNAGSTLSYPSRFDKERRITLDGEAYFEVTKNPDKPFIVSTEHVQIKALGTEFNVHSYSKTHRMHTTLVSGSIMVYEPYAEAAGQILFPNEQLFYENGIFRLERAPDKEQLLWKEGIYSMRKETLDQAIPKLELYYDIKIHVTHPDILKYEYTGKFRQQDGILQILQLIQRIHPFEIAIDQESQEITLSKKIS